MCHLSSSNPWRTSLLLASMLISDMSSSSLSFLRCFFWGPSLPLLMLSRLTYLRSIFFHLFSRLLSSLFNLSPKRCITAVVWMPSPPHLMFSWFFLNSILLKLWVQMVFLKLCAAALCEPLHHLFCASLTTSCIPSKWKVHYITSIQ